MQPSFIGNYSGYCHCLSGYWGPKCENICPGGAGNPCYGNGNCNPETGQCTCFAGARQESNCSQCREGWFGTDCSVAMLDYPVSGETQKHVAASYGSGHFLTFDGSLYTYQGPGEHVFVEFLFPGSRTIFKVHGKLVIAAASGSVLCQAIAVAIGKDIFEVHTLSADIVLAYNGLQISMLSFPGLFGQNVSCNIISTKHLRIVGGSTLTVDIYIRETSIDVQVRASFEVCSASRGLFSSCGRTPTPVDDFVTRNDTRLSNFTDPYLNQKAIHEIFGPSWLVTKADSIFLYLPVLSPLSGHGLKFKHSHAVSDPLNLFSTSEATVEVKFKLDYLSLSGDCQAVWSYRAKLGLDITLTVCGSKVVLYHGVQEHITSITVQVNTWYHLSLAWVSRQQLIQLVLLTDRLTISSANIYLQAGAQVFLNGGNLILGKRSIVSTDVTGFNWNLQGVIDDIRVWKISLSVTEIRQWFDSYFITNVALTCHWMFEEGAGILSVDSIAGIVISFPQDPWWHPAWINSNYPYVMPSLLQYNIYSNLLTGYSNNSVSFCSAHVFVTTITTACSYLGSSALQAFYQQCVFNGDVFHSPDATLEVIITLADICYHYSQFSDALSWPARRFCNDFPQRHFPVWRGTYCSQECYSGMWSTNTSSCSCDDNFYDASCSHLCPAYKGVSCNSGLCSEKGICRCSLRTDVTTDCQQCSNGWKGSDCSIAMVDTTFQRNNTQVCSLFGFSHIIMFDGQSYDFDTVGEFMLADIPEVGLYVRLLQCPGNRAVCLRSLWMKSEEDNLTISISDNQGTGLTLWRNGEAAVNDSMQLPGSNATLTMFSPTTAEIAVGLSLRVSITVQDFLMSISVSSHSANCMSAKGLCGNCDHDVDNDFIGTGLIIPLAQVNTSFINTDFASRWSIRSWPTTGFIYQHNSGIKEPRFPSQDGFSLHFNGSAAYTGALTGILATSDVSIEMKIQPVNTTQGTLFVYSTTTTRISVTVNNSMLAVGVLGRDVLTSLVVKPGVLQHLAVVVSRSSKTISVYLVLPGANIHSYVLSLESSLVLANGRLSIAGNNDALSTYFSGLVDEIRVWTKPLTVYEILQTSYVKVNITYQGILAVWPLSEGRGLVSVDIVSGISLFLPQSGVTWVYSSFLWVDESPLLYYARHTNYPETEIPACNRLKNDSIIARACQPLGRALLDFAYRACVADVEASPTSMVYASNMAAYISYCIFVLQPKDPPTTTICQNKSDPLYTYLCQAACKFGTVDESSGGICKCDPGRWGFDCGGTCPGGVSNPCHSHGFCNTTTGACTCQPTWSEGTDCATCKTGWAGPDCSTYKPDLPSAPTNNSNETTTMKACTIFGLTHVLSLSDTSFSIQQPGEFSFLKALNFNLDLQTRITFCQEATLCVSAMGVRLGSDTIVIRAGYRSQDFAKVWVNGNLVTSPSPGSSFSGLSSIVLTWDSSHEYTINDANKLFNLKVRTNQRRIGLTLRANLMLCHNSSSCGICGYNQTDKSVPQYSSWQVSAELSLFTGLFVNSLYGETSIISPAAYSLLLQNNGISSEILPMVFQPSQDFSVALLVNPRSAEGVVMSYGKSSIFGLFYDTTIKLMVGKVTHDTGLKLKINSWNEIVLVYTVALFQFDIYIHNADTEISFKQIFISENFVFEGSGVLTVGGWVQVTAGGEVFIPPVTNFTGEVDELRIWHKTITYSEIERQWQTGHLFAAAGLFVHWSFNEGEGVVVVDIIQKYIFNFFAFDLTKPLPLWRLSTAVYTYPFIPATHAFLDNELLIVAETKCRSTLYSASLTSSCPVQHQTFVEFYLAVCLSDIAATHEVSAALTAVLSFSDLCVASISLDRWPARLLCNQFSNFPRFTGINCTTECLFSAYQDNDLQKDINLPQTSMAICQCHPAFWGPHCQQVCPAGVVNPCNGHGGCNSTNGNCICDVGWGGSNCSHCEDGWHGSDCSVAVQSIQSTTEFCSLTANSHLFTLDGAGLTFKQEGIFTFYQDDTLSFKVEIQARQCHKFGTCILAAAMKVQTDSLVFDALDSDHMVLNQERVSLSADRTLSGSFKLVALDRYTFELQHSSKIQLRVSIREAYLDLHITVSKSCENPRGICGRCSPKENHGCATEDHTCIIAGLGVSRYLSLYPAASFRAIEIYLSSWQQTFAGSLFATASGPVSVSNPVAVAISLSGGYLITAPIPDGILSTTAYLTIEISLKLSPDFNLSSSVIWSYAQARIFAVLVQNGSLAIYFRGTVTVTSLQVQLDVWTSLAVVYNRDKGSVTLHYVWQDQGIVRHVYDIVVVGIGAFPGNGTLAVGVWQITTDNVPYPKVSVNNTDII